MTRYLWIAVLCAAWLGASVPAAAAGARVPTGAPVVTPAPGSATAALQDCHVAVAQTDRSVTFSGEMTTMPGARRMAIRVDLLERRAGARMFHGVNAPGLGEWRRSTVGVQVYRYVKQVVNLPAPATYLGVIAFRWLDTHGHVIRQLHRRTTACQQPDPRPLLRIGRVTVTATPGSADATYAITVRDDGHGAADGFPLTLSVNGAPQPQIDVLELDPFSQLEVDTTAPRCTAGSTLTVTPDPQHQLDEAPGGGMARTIACPLAAGAGTGSTLQ